MVVLQVQVLTKYVYFNDFRNNHRKTTKIFSRKRNGLIKDGEL